MANPNPLLLSCSITFTNHYHYRSNVFLIRKSGLHTLIVHQFVKYDLREEIGDGK